MDDPKHPARELPALPQAEAVPVAHDAESIHRKPPRHDDPTRYGDWELSGKCVDF